MKRRTEYRRKQLQLLLSEFVVMFELLMHLFADTALGVVANKIYFLKIQVPMEQGNFGLLPLSKYVLLVHKHPKPQPLQQFKSSMKNLNNLVDQCDINIPNQIKSNK
jgi:hypothetical protein